MHIVRLFVFAFLLLFSPLFAVRVCGPHFISLGPESYYLKRDKKGGSWEDGWLYGIRGSYEKLNERGLYFSLDGYWATGELEGNSNAGNTLKSDIKEYQLEGRIGGSYSFPKSTRVTWVPYLAYGYFSSHHHFVSPSPLTYRSKSDFYYYGGGGMVLVSLGDCWNAGLHFKYKLPEEPKCTIENDPEFGKIVLNIGVHAQYEVELPIRYRSNWLGRQTGLMITPFYRFVHFGGQANHPNDYIDTRFHAWGARLLFQLIL